MRELEKAKKENVHELPELAINMPDGVTKPYFSYRQPGVETLRNGTCLLVTVSNIH
jgi:hypothetical protein